MPLSKQQWEDYEATMPKHSDTDLRNAIRTVYNHMHKTEKASGVDLLLALEVMKDMADNSQWCVYVP